MTIQQFYESPDAIILLIEDKDDLYRFCKKADELNYPVYNLRGLDYYKCYCDDERKMWGIANSGKSFNMEQFRKCTDIQIIHFQFIREV